ncbi:MAG: hypothetical protein II395_04890, partial [Ruminococcus sp.]|nr:hypothetical protein [Ruminococcus sp.]
TSRFPTDSSVSLHPIPPLKTLCVRKTPSTAGLNIEISNKQQRVAAPNPLTTLFVREKKDCQPAVLFCVPVVLTSGGKSIIIEVTTGRTRFAHFSV